MHNLLYALLLLLPAACQTTQDAKVSVSPSKSGYSQLTVTSDEGKLLLFLRGGEDVTAILDGELLPDDRVVREGDRLRILCSEGETLFDVRIIDGGGAAYPYDGGTYTLARTRDNALTADRGSGVDDATRRIIGVMMTPVDEGLAAQLGIEPEQAYVINEVSSGLPAEKGGVQRWDVLVRIDGEGPGTVERLREVLRVKQPGETVKLSILRKGEPVELEVGFQQSGSSLYSGTDLGRLVESGTLKRLGVDADQQALATMRIQEALRNTLWSQDRSAGELQKELEQARVDLETRVVELRDAEAAASAGAPDDPGVTEARLKELRAAVELAQARTREIQDRLSVSRLGAGFVDLGRDGGRALFVPPNSYGVGAAPRDPSDDRRLAQMEERMARLEEMLSKLVESEKKR